MAARPSATRAAPGATASNWRGPHQSADQWRTELAYTWLDARYLDLHIGQRIPGIARQSLYAAFGYMPPEGWHAGAELRALGSIPVNDANSASAAGYALVALHAGYRKQVGRWELQAFARLDNALDRRYIGSVIVNEGNQRYFEPAPGRNWTAGARGVLQVLSASPYRDDPIRSLVKVASCVDLKIIENRSR